MSKTETKPAESKGKRLTLSFTGKYADLYDAILKAASDEDRDPDAVVLRVLSASYLSSPAPQGDSTLQLS